MNGCGFNIILNNYFGSIKNTLRYAYIALLPGATLRFDHILLFAEAGHYVQFFFYFYENITTNFSLSANWSKRDVRICVHSHLSYADESPQVTNTATSTNIFIELLFIYLFPAWSTSHSLVSFGNNSGLLVKPDARRVDLPAVRFLIAPRPPAALDAQNSRFRA